MSFTYLLPIVNMEPGIEPRVELMSQAGTPLNFSDGASAKLATAVGASNYYLYSTQWPSGSNLPFVIKVSNHSSGSLLAIAAFNTYDVPVSTGGAGGIATTITVEDQAGNPLQGVEVWVTTDNSGTNVVAGTLLTDNFGNVTFYLDPGIYYLWRQKPLYTFINPEQFTVS
jgi:hypothetical protein